MKSKSGSGPKKLTERGSAEMVRRRRARNEVEGDDHGCPLGSGGAKADEARTSIPLSPGQQLVLAQLCGGHCLRVLGALCGEIGGVFDINHEGLEEHEGGMLGS